MKVFRMQDSFNTGPFMQNPPANASFIAAFCYDDWRCNYINIDGHHPGPGDDGLRQYLHSNKEALFGCPSLYMVCRWFHPLFPVMEELGLEVVEYDAPNAWLGRKMSQVVFCHETATRVRTVPITELLTHKEIYESSIE